MHKKKLVLVRLVLDPFHTRFGNETVELYRCIIARVWICMKQMFKVLY